MRIGRWVAAAIGLTALAACGESDPPATQTRPDEFIARGTVLQDESHGPQLCLGGVAASFPPQCGGPDLVGWDWSAVDDFQHVNGARWGEFVVIGRYDPSEYTMKLTRPAVPAAAYRGPYFKRDDPEPVWTTPCREPAGGWRVIDPTLTTDEAMERTIRAAQGRPDFGALWVDQSINPASKDGHTDDSDQRMNDPRLLILNVAVTGDVTTAEKDLRATWGGALCVSRSKHTERELLQVQERIGMKRDVLSAGVGRDVVEVEVVWDDGSLQGRFDQQFGAGTVKVSSALTPFRGGQP